MRNVFYNVHNDSIGTGWKTNESGITFTSTGASDTAAVDQVNSIISGESLTFTIPNDYNESLNGSLKYYCYTHNSMIQEFNLIEYVDDILTPEGIELNGVDRYIDLGENVIEIGGTISFETQIEYTDPSKQTFSVLVLPVAQA